MIPFHYVGGRLARNARAKRRDLRALRVLVVHRFGGWPSGFWEYPTTAAGARAARVPWRPELARRRYDDTPDGIARYAVEVMGWSGHPYTFQIRGGEIYQTAPLDVITPHVASFNLEAAAILVTGDHRRAPPPEADLEAAAYCAAEVCLELGWTPAEGVTLEGRRVRRVAGHDEMPAGATGTPGKRCPGDFLSMPDFRPMVAERLARLRADFSEASRVPIVLRSRPWPPVRPKKT